MTEFKANISITFKSESGDLNINLEPTNMNVMVISFALDILKKNITEGKYGAPRVIPSFEPKRL